MLISKDFNFECSGCKEMIEVSGYAIAQIASGNELTFSCVCGAKTNLEGFEDE